MNFDFTGKVCLITGSSSGIGAGTAELFSKCGATVVITGRNEEKLKKTSAKCTEASPQKLQPLSVVVELTNEKDVVNLVETVIKKLHKIDILINNAGIAMEKSITEISMENYDQIMNVNLRSVFSLTKLCIPHLIETKGNIVNVSSIFAQLPAVAYGPYCVSKSAVDQFTRCTALELAPKGVRVNAVNPGVIDTDMNLKTAGSEEAYEKFLEYIKKIHALGRHGKVEDVAAPIVFLASDHASFITGVTLPVDGIMRPI